MKTLYIDCGMGAAGDMLTAALLELLPEEDRERFTEEFNLIGIPEVIMNVYSSVKCGIMGTHVSMLIEGEEEGTGGYKHEHGHNHSHEHSHIYTDGSAHTHIHTGMGSIEHIICDHLSVSDKVKGDIQAVYNMIAEAESSVHGVPVTDIHFHEIGSMDAFADITAVCMLMERISAEQIIISPVNTGSGTVKCTHGILPVPAPATAYILKGVPVYSNGIRSELTTPTGAALLKHFATGFGTMPVMRIDRIGYGMGTKDFDAANCVRVMMGIAF